ncbi:hypothetical protein BDQ12DRAFT_691896 [Crucibulum laeve]|uniref:Uncharacterized protein n=1 Tax=Crucibulum laeve TaxID=68775 RepID=A0A5C3LVS9_9AGAR|nr:hypothetical protein BDQ12DRAFT_691896 [Crucibulum laeve]
MWEEEAHLEERKEGEGKEHKEVDAVEAHERSEDPELEFEEEREEGIISAWIGACGVCTAMLLCSTVALEGEDDEDDEDLDRAFTTLKMESRAFARTITSGWIGL